ncbi:hypothetical protein PAPYR_127 [Paratrimastix pyriformis]|uniref:Uncharacterized protein n=1 Tax=Paratrimastix pyriformis TaxID=342808 RepID=A0ABQ8UUX7_9EUKA|nr:hypothetical protein PAPYR_127 [Paratrimastix pyriformis]
MNLRHQPTNHTGGFPHHHYSSNNPHPAFSLRSFNQALRHIRSQSFRAVPTAWTMLRRNSQGRNHPSAYDSFEDILHELVDHKSPPPPQPQQEDKPLPLPPFEPALSLESPFQEDSGPVAAEPCFAEHRDDRSARPPSPPGPSDAHCLFPHVHRPPNSPSPGRRSSSPSLLGTRNSGAHLLRFADPPSRILQTRILPHTLPPRVLPRTRLPHTLTATHSQGPVGAKPVAPQRAPPPNPKKKLLPISTRAWEANLLALQGSRAKKSAEKGLASPVPPSAQHPPSPAAKPKHKKKPTEPAGQPEGATERHQKRRIEREEAPAGTVATAPAAPTPPHSDGPVLVELSDLIFQDDPDDSILLLETTSSDTPDSGASLPQPPLPQPPLPQPPATQPPATQPPATQPPATQPPATLPAGSPPGSSSDEAGRSPESPAMPITNPPQEKPSPSQSLGTSPAPPISPCPEPAPPPPAQPPSAVGIPPQAPTPPAHTNPGSRRKSTPHPVHFVRPDAALTRRVIDDDNDAASVAAAIEEQPPEPEDMSLRPPIEDWCCESCHKWWSQDYLIADEYWLDCKTCHKRWCWSLTGHRVQSIGFLQLPFFRNCSACCGLPMHQWLLNLKRRQREMEEAEKNFRHDQKILAAEEIRTEIERFEHNLGLKVEKADEPATPSRAHEIKELEMLGVRKARPPPGNEYEEFFDYSSRASAAKPKSRLSPSAAALPPVQQIPLSLDPLPAPEWVLPQDVRRPFSVTNPHVASPDVGLPIAERKRSVRRREVHWQQPRGASSPGEAGSTNRGAQTARARLTGRSFLEPYLLPPALTAPKSSPADELKNPAADRRPFSAASRALRLPPRVGGDCSAPTLLPLQRIQDPIAARGDAFARAMEERALTSRALAEEARRETALQRHDQTRDTFKAKADATFRRAVALQEPYVWKKLNATAQLFPPGYAPDPFDPASTTQLAARAPSRVRSCLLTPSANPDPTSLCERASPPRPVPPPTARTTEGSSSLGLPPSRYPGGRATTATTRALAPSPTGPGRPPRPPSCTSTHATAPSRRLARERLLGHAVAEDEDDRPPGPEEVGAMMREMDRLDAALSRVEWTRREEDRARRRQEEDALRRAMEAAPAPPARPF